MSNARVEIEWRDNDVKKAFVHVYGVGPEAFRLNVTNQLKKELALMVNNRIEEIVRHIGAEFPGTANRHQRDRLVAFVRAQRSDPGK